MKLVLLLIVAGIMLAGCEAKKKNHKPRHQEMECGHSISHMIGLNQHRDILHIDSVISCYQNNGYDYCNNNLDESEKEALLDTCESHVKAFLNDVTDIVGHKPHWMDDVFPRQRDARSRSRSRSTGTGQSSSVPSSCQNFASDIVSFLDSLAPIMSRAIDDVGRCFSGSRSVTSVVSCVIDNIIFFLFPFLRDGFIRCILAFLGI